MLARILQHNGIPCAIFEKDQDRNPPELLDHSGTLDLLKEKANLASREAGLLDAFVKVATPKGKMSGRFFYLLSWALAGFKKSSIENVQQLLDH